MLSIKKISRCLLITAIAAASSSFAADIYRCKMGNSVKYQAQPCDPGSEQKIIDSSIYPQSIAIIPGTSQDEKEKGNVDISKTAKKMTITRSMDSHYYVEGEINGVPIHFLIDTGASLVAIPQNIALQAGLRDEREVNAGTAGGLIKSFQTTIRTLSVESFKFDSVLATIVAGEQALLGMNVLKNFEISQKGDDLVLTYKGE